MLALYTALAYLLVGSAVTFLVAREDRATGRPYAFNNTAGYAAAIVVLPLAGVLILALLALAFAVWPIAALLRKQVESKPPVVDLPPEQFDAFFRRAERERRAHN